ncbi:DUF4199 domain-containing protein [Spirosoma fluminis]
MNDTTSTARVALKWGLITGLGLVVYSVILYTLDLTAIPWLGALIYVLLIVGLILGMREYRSANSGYMSYSEGLSIGALLSAIAGFLSSAFSVFYTTIIDPGFQERLYDQMREQMEEQGKLSDEKIDSMMEMTQKFQGPGITFFFGIFWFVLIGVILSLIIAAVMRKNKNNPFD